MELFDGLNEGDLLFIDSSHVVKYKSDVNFLIFDILPNLKSGTFVHFHDIFYPFEYPLEWLKEGIYLNESYLIRSFLAYNSGWDIYFFNSYVHTMLNNFLKINIQLYYNHPGGSLYIRKK